MNLRRTQRDTAEVYTGSLNDIMFFLLLFFLILSTLANPSVVKLLLPKTKAGATVTDTKPRINLAVDATKTYYIDDKPVEFAQLETTLKNKIANVNEPLVVLRFDNSLSVQDLVDVLQIGSNLKVKMVLGTQRVSAE